MPKTSKQQNKKTNGNSENVQEKLNNATNSVLGQNQSHNTKKESLGTNTKR